jgi:putative ABC transport system permease protein
MNTGQFYLRYALRSLRRDGTRTLLAILCVAFGVLSLVSMQLLADTLLSSELFDQRLSFGGDAQLQRENEGRLTGNDLAQIEQWQQNGWIRVYPHSANQRTLPEDGK